MSRWGVFALLLAGCVSHPVSSPSLQRFEYREYKLGSDFNFLLYAPDKATADAAERSALARVDELDWIFSDYKAESEISKLSRLTNAGPMTKPVAISRELYEVLAMAQDVARTTDGAFDVTVGPYVQLWRRSKRQQMLPNAERLVEAKASVGWQFLQISHVVGPANGSDGTIRDSYFAQLLAASMRLDVGGIASGYIADDVLSLLRKRGITRALIDASGDLSAGDPPPGRRGWKVAIQALTEPGKTANFIEVANCGVSTSGDTYRYVEIDGVRYSHIVDTKTGLGLTHRIGVTTIAPTGVAADVMATAVSVLGSERGMKWVDVITQTPAFKGSGARITEIRDGTTNVIESQRYKQVDSVPGVGGEHP